MSGLFKNFFVSLRRIISGGNYIPQVDGLRFVAIFMVVCIAHIPNFINKELTEGALMKPDSYAAKFSLEGIWGVQLFFMISGFILGLAFAKLYINNNEKADLKKYYLRRLTRLEPPYIIALLLFFIALVFVINKYSFAELLPRFFASVFYLHGPVYNEHSLIIPVAWTLEVEVQYYIICPLLAVVYKIKNRNWRWAIFIIAIIGNAAWWVGRWEYGYLLKFINYFLCGMLMADWYTEKIVFIKNEKIGFVVGLLALISLPFVLGLYGWQGYTMKYLLMFILMYQGLTNRYMIKIFSWLPLTIIGGICYSIYLIHEQVISAAGRILKHIDTGNVSANFMIYFLLITFSILIFSIVFYKLAEQPFMRRGWWKFRK